MGSLGVGLAGDGGPPVPTTLADQYLKRTGALYETCGRRFITGTNTPVSGTLQLSELVLPAGLTISNIAFVSTAAASVPTHWWFGLFDNNRNALAFTADQLATAWGATTEQILPIATVAAGAATSFTTTYTGLHYLAVMQAATTPATLAGFAATASALAPIPAGNANAGQTTVPAFPFQASALAQIGVWLYAYVS